MRASFVFSNFWLALLTLLFVGPLVLLLLQIDWQTTLEVLGSKSLGKSIAVTLLSSFGGSLISLAIAVPFAFFFAHFNWKGKRAERLGLLLPYLIPNFVLASAYVIAWNPASGILNPLFCFPLGLYGTWGMSVLFGITHFPVAFLILEEKIRRIDSSLLEGARMSGATQAKTLLKIELPLLRPALFSSFALCFALCLSSFAIPAWIGAPAKAYPLTYKIYQSLQLGGPEGLRAASATALLLLAFALLPVLLQSLEAKHDKRYAVLSGKSTRASITTPSRGAFLLFQAFYFAFQFFAWIAPLGVLLLTTVVKPGCLQTSGLASCLDGFSLQSYRYVLFELSETRLALEGSLLYGGLSALVILLVSILSLVAFSSRPRHLQFLEWIFALPIATPGAILALSLIVSASGQFGLNLYNTPWIVVLAYVQKHLNLSFQPLRTGLLNLSPSLLEAARLSGASTRALWTRIVLPILKPECLGGFFLVLIPIVGELTMSLFLMSPSFRSIGTVLFDLQDYADQASAGALSVCLVIFILVANELARLLSRGRLGY